MPLAIDVDYSIIICTYNPDERLLKRCLNAVSLLRFQSLSVEIILVDNNSTSPLVTVDYIQDFLNKVPGSKLIEAPEQGLNHARMAGINSSRGAYIVFFDDDNEPDENYLTTLSGLHQDYPNVAAWGPGNVHVDFIEGVTAKLENYAREAFQERHETRITYANQISWQSCYPFGTGLCLERKYFEAYRLRSEQGHFSLSDRKGNQLSSGGDTQMVLFCISKGAAAGVAPELKLTHIVPGKRAEFDYLKKLTYGTSVCYSTCMLEVFPDYLNKLERHVVPARKFKLKTLKKYCLLMFTRKPKKAFDLIAYIGAVSGDYEALHRTVPPLIYWVLRKLKAI